MSTLSNLSNYGTDYQIGEVVNVLTGGAGSNAQVALNSGGFIECGNIYNQADYPQLYAKLGNINAQRFPTPTTAANVSIFSLDQVTYGNSIYVQVGYNSILGVAVYATSTDLTTWVSAPLPANSGVGLSNGSIAYGNGIFVVPNDAVGTSLLCTSTDGSTWQTSSNVGSLSELLFTGSNFAAYRGSNVLTSTNGVTWTTFPITPTLAPNKFDYANGRYFVGTSSSSVYTSVDLVTWTKLFDITGGGSLKNVSYGNGIYLINFTTGSPLYSTDLTNWTTLNSATIGFLVPASTSVASAVFDSINNNFILTGTTTGEAENFYVSSDLLSWTKYTQTGLLSSASGILSKYKSNKVFFSTFDYRFTVAPDITKLSVASYDATTQFYVPEYTLNNSDLTISGWSVATRTGALWQSYIKAK